MFVWVWCFAWIVWLLCACGVRRFRGLKRASPLFYLFRLCFISFASVFLLLRLSFVLFLVLLLLCLPFFLSSLLLLLSLFLLSSACPLGCLASALGLVFSLCGLLFLFPFRYIRKKKGRSVLVRPLLSCCGFVISS